MSGPSGADALSEDAKALLTRVARAVERDRPIVFLFGSALTRPMGPGVAGVSDVRGIVERIVEALGDDAPDEFTEAVEAAKASKKYGPAYQAGFAAMHRVGSVDEANALIRAAVLEAHRTGVPGNDRQAVGDPSQWKPLSPAITALGEILANNHDRFATVLTTNFDPLIEVATAHAATKPGATAHRNVMDRDGNIGQGGGTGSKIVYLHGYWTGSDTLHSAAQLEDWRPKLHGSLRSLLQGAELVVMGYAGWDDAVMGLLDSFAQEGDGKVSIAWAFYDAKSHDDSKRIIDRLKAFGPRAQFFEHVDLHKWLPKLRDRLDRRPKPATSATAPGASVFVPNLPSTNAIFRGREDELAKIRAALTTSHRVAVHPVLAGLGGVGKSRLALRYAELHATDYAIRWFVGAATPASYHQDMAALGDKLGLPMHGLDLEAASRATMEHLQTRKDWLLILDNVPRRKELKGLLPKSCTGHILITSRATAWGGVGRAISIDHLDPEAAVALLADRSGRPKDKAAADLAKELGYLPLAIVQAAAFIEHSRTTFAKYLADFRTRSTAIFENQFAEADDYNSTVAKTWLPNMLAVRARKPTAARLLELLSFLDPDGVPEPYLQGDTTRLPPTWSAAIEPSTLDTAIAALRDYSLVDRDDDTLRVHRLVQAVTRAAMDPAERDTLASATLRWARVRFGYEAEKIAIRLVPEGTAEQAAAVAARAECAHAAPSEAMWLLIHVSDYWQTRGVLTAAKTVLSAAHRGAKRRFDNAPDDPKAQRDLSVSLNFLGNVEVQAGNLSQARTLFDRSLRLRERLAEDDPQNAQTQRDLSLSLNELGNVEVQAGNLSNARTLFDRSLKLRERLAEDDPQNAQAQRDVFVSLCNLADLDVRDEHVDQARAHLERARSILEALSNAGLMEGNALFANDRAYVDARLAQL